VGDAPMYGAHPSGSVCVLNMLGASPASRLSTGAATSLDAAEDE
jgi:hypothetical protein